MATKKKTRKKLNRAKKAAGGKTKPIKKQAKRAAVPTKAAKKGKGLAKKTVGAKAASASKKKTPKSSQRPNALGFSAETPRSRSGEQSGDLQGLSNVESVDSESVDELIEEGNAFEAGVVSGVEDSGEGAPREVRTREVPEDDVSGEYLDED
jgi:hypothetical protein